MADWMRDLPLRLRQVAINKIAIPGSHDSGAFYLDPDSPIAPSEPKAIVYLTKLFGRCAKKIVHNWSITQTLTVTQQLIRGIRYLDVRSAYWKEHDDFFVVHGLYGLKTTQILQEVKDFLDSHPKELVILDFNHFYDFTDAIHERFANLIIKYFKGSLCGPEKGGNVTMEEIWVTRSQVIACYHNPEITRKYSMLWTSSLVYSPWPNTTSTSELTDYLNARFSDLKLNSLNVFQGVLTPSTSTVVAHLGSSLKETLGLKSDITVRSWLDEILAKKEKGANIIMCDFVDNDQCIEAILKLNTLY